ncbi:MAG TPA: zf-HC2 domain-containing protein [Gemmatimonadales bacterium]|nr:zf-HC2 domain-containing protein [Gemmatimonadales bacterium]
MTTPYNCRQVLDELQDFLRQETTPESAAAIEAHLVLCAPCRAHTEFERGFQEVLARATREERCPPELRARLIEALRREAGE